jgi:hypothetical protein
MIQGRTWIGITNNSTMAHLLRVDEGTLHSRFEKEFSSRTIWHTKALNSVIKAPNAVMSSNKIRACVLHNSLEQRHVKPPNASKINLKKMPLIDSITMSSTSQTLSLESSLPIELLSTDLARIYTHIHPAILLSAYYLRFPALVADPVSTLLNSLLPLAIIQASYAVICLPATGGTSTKQAKKPKPGVKKIDAPVAQPFVRSMIQILPWGWYGIC